MKEIDRNAWYLDAKVFYEAVSHFGNDNYEAAQDPVCCPLYLLNLFEYGGCKYGTVLVSSDGGFQLYQID